MRHLGSRVSALLDGQLSAAEEDEAWAHVHSCHPCRDLVEREGWVKTQVLGLSHASAPLGLKGALGDPEGCASRLGASTAPSRRPAMVVLGGGAVGAAALGMLALVAGPSVQVDQRPSTQINGASSTGSSLAGHRSADLPRRGTRRGQVGLVGVRLVP